MAEGRGWGRGQAKRFRGCRADPGCWPGEGPRWTPGRVPVREEPPEGKQGREMRESGKPAVQLAATCLRAGCPLLMKSSRAPCLPLLSALPHGCRPSTSPFCTENIRSRGQRALSSAPALAPGTPSQPSLSPSVRPAMAWVMMSDSPSDCRESGPKSPE